MSFDRLLQGLRKRAVIDTRGVTIPSVRSHSASRFVVRLVLRCKTKSCWVRTYAMNAPRYGGRPCSRERKVRIRADGPVPTEAHRMHTPCKPLPHQLRRGLMQVGTWAT